jgi:hypothetical protein
MAEVMTMLSVAGSDFESMNELVAERASKKVEKLIAAGGDERHLFVWLRGSATDAQPEILEGIDVVWLAVAGGPGQPFSRLWRLRLPRGWVRLSAHSLAGGRSDPCDRPDSRPSDGSDSGSPCSLS